MVRQIFFHKQASPAPMDRQGAEPYALHDLTVCQLEQGVDVDDTAHALGRARTLWELVARRADLSPRGPSSSRTTAP